MAADNATMKTHIIRCSVPRTMKILLQRATTTGTFKEGKQYRVRPIGTHEISDISMVLECARMKWVARIDGGANSMRDDGKGRVNPCENVALDAILGRLQLLFDSSRGIR
jgi:hypothetical protein